MLAGDGAWAERLRWGVRSILFSQGVRGLLAQKSGGSAKRFSIKDEGCDSEARSRRVGGPPGTRRRRISASIIDPFGCFLDVEGGKNVFYEATERGSERMVAEERKDASRVDLSAHSVLRRSEARRGRHVTGDM